MFFYPEWSNRNSIPFTFWFISLIEETYYITGCMLWQRRHYFWYIIFWESQRDLLHFKLSEKHCWIISYGYNVTSLFLWLMLFRKKTYFYFNHCVINVFYEFHVCISCNSLYLVIRTYLAYWNLLMIVTIWKLTF